jgi:hypothetical protein
MNDRIAVAIVESTCYLSGKLSRGSFPQPSVADNVVEHLTSVDELEHHVIMIGMNNHLPHPADVWVVQE